MSASNYIPQAQLERLKALVKPGKVIVIYGPRRVGKTTLIKHFADSAGEKAMMVSGEEISVREYLASESLTKLKSFVGSNRLLIVDEAQYVNNIGLNLKLLIDHVPGLRIIATGSSSFELAHQTGEPLTGRKYTLLLLPLAQMELNRIEAVHETRASREARLLFGSYPEVVLLESNEERRQYLNELVSSYLLKDILQLDQVRHSNKLLRLLQLLAFQIGREVSVAELGTQLGMSKNTVDRYLDLLEKVFVIYRRTGFSRNLRKEITKSHRFYFTDNGIRNALIDNFNPLTLRNDIGALWENYLLTERWKFHLYRGHAVRSYFWRTYDRKEIDLIEDADGLLRAFEIKWKRADVKAPKAWREAYPDSTFQVVDGENYLDFIN